MRSSVKIFCLTLATLLMTACLPPGVKTSSSDEEGLGAENSSDLNEAKTTSYDFKGRCGIDMDEAQEEGKTLLDVHLKSFPFYAQGNKLGVKFKITLEAEFAMSLKSGQSASTGGQITVSVKDVQVDAASPLLKIVGLAVAKSKAKEMVEFLSSPVVSTTIPTGKWLNLSTADGQYKNIVCAVPPVTVKKSRTFKGKQFETVFSPGIAEAINPMASEKTIREEIGVGRTLTTSMDVIHQAPGGLKEGTYQSTSRYRLVKPEYSFPDGRRAQSDLAVEVVTTSQVGDQTSAPDLPDGTKLFFINSSKKTFDAVVIKSVVRDGVELTDIVLVAQ